MLTFKAEVLKSKQKSDGTYNVKIRMTYNREVKRLTTSLLKDFIDYLVRKREEKVKLLMKQGKRVPSNRVVSLYLGSIRHLFNEARKQYNDYDRDMILIPHSPFDNFKIPKQEATRKRAISAELIKKIYK